MNRQPSPSDTSEASSLGEPPLTDSNAIRDAHDSGGMTTEPRLTGKLPDRPLRVVLLSLHGLIRSEEPQLGYDADTGGQVLYVLELARAHTLATLTAARKTIGLYTFELPGTRSRFMYS